MWHQKAIQIRNKVSLRLWPHSTGNGVAAPLIRSRLTAFFLASLPVPLEHWLFNQVRIITFFCLELFCFNPFAKHVLLLFITLVPLETIVLLVSRSLRLLSPPSCPHPHSESCFALYHARQTRLPVLTSHQAHRCSAVLCLTRLRLRSFVVSFKPNQIKFTKTAFLNYDLPFSILATSFVRSTGRSLLFWPSTLTFRPLLLTLVVRRSRLSLSLLLADSLVHSLTRTLLPLKCAVCPLNAQFTFIVFADHHHHQHNYHHHYYN
jgi:hypothetical protein